MEDVMQKLKKLPLSSDQVVLSFSSCSFECRELCLPVPLDTFPKMLKIQNCQGCVIHLLSSRLHDTPGDYPQTSNMSLAQSTREDDKHMSWMINLFSLQTHPKYPFVYLLHPGVFWQTIITSFFT